MDQKTPVISLEKREQLKTSIIDYFATDQDIDIGPIAAEEIIEAILKGAGQEIYNQAITDAQKVIRQGTESLIINIDCLTKTD